MTTDVNRDLTTHSTPRPMPLAPASVATTAGADAPAGALSVEVALGAASLVGAAAVARLVAGGWSGTAGWPVLAATLAGYLIMAVGLRRRFSPPLVASVAVVVVALVSTAGAVPGATRYGLPTGRAPHRVDLALAGVRDAASGWHWPLAARPGVVLLAALVAGLSAVAARAWAGPPWRWRPAAGLVPPLVLVTASAMAVTDAGAAWTVVGLVVAGGVTVVLDDRGPSPARGPDRRRLRLGAGLVGAALVAASITALAVGSPDAVSSGARAGAAGGPAITPTGLALATDLVGLSQRDPRVVLFHARTPTNTYWQLGLLTDWRQGQWVPDPATEAVLGTAPTAPTVAAPSVPTPRGTFDAQVTMAALSSRLLPAPPGAVAVTPPGRAQVTAIGVVAPAAARPGEAYAVTAAVAPSVTDLGLGGAPPGPAADISPADLREALVVPPVPSSVLALAHQVTASAATPLTKAEALVDWFRSGAFRYTLDPPPTPAGTDPLVAFLTTTRAGTCESFASAFTVLARAVGLPTRIAIGFTGGTRGSDGTTTVRGADAHAWPQVELGSVGWVSFEPTPQLPSGELSPPDVVGPTALIAPTTVAPPTTAPPRGTTRTTAPVPTTVPPAPTTASSGASTTTAIVPSTATSAAPRLHRGSRGWWRTGLWVGVVVIGLLALAGLVAVVHLVRDGRTRAGRTREGLVGSYRRAIAPLAGTAWARPASEPPSVHARGLRELAERLTDAEASTVSASPATIAQLRAASVELTRLAGLLEDQLYAPRPPSPNDTTWAVEAADRISTTLAEPRVRAVLSTPPVGRSSLPV